MNVIFNLNFNYIQTNAPNLALMSLGLQTLPSSSLIQILAKNILKMPQLSCSHPT